MTGVGARIELNGIAAAQAGLARLVALGQDLTPVYDEIGNAMVASQQRRFELGVEPDGTPWMESWRARETGGKTLIDTGALLDNITHNADAGGVEWGYSLRKAPMLHFGGVIHAKSGKALVFTGSDGHLVFAQNVVIPARPIVGTNDQDIAAIVSIVGGAVERAAAGSAP